MGGTCFQTQKGNFLYVIKGHLFLTNFKVLLYLFDTCATFISPFSYTIIEISPLCLLTVVFYARNLNVGTHELGLKPADKDTCNRTRSSCVQFFFSIISFFDVSHLTCKSDILF